MEYEIHSESFPFVEVNSILKNNPRRLSVVTLANGQDYFIDTKLREFRNVTNPHDRISF